MTGAREQAGCLGEQGRLADAGIAADQQHRAAHEAATGDAVELGHSGRQARRLLALAGQRLQRELPAFTSGADRDRHGAGRIFFRERIPLAAGLALALPAVVGRAAVLTDKGEGGFGHEGSTSRFDELAPRKSANRQTTMPGIVTPGIAATSVFPIYLLIVTNGTAEPGTIVVGSTPFQRSACVKAMMLGFDPSASARALMAAASASPVTLMLEARASPFSFVASALACASARTALAFAVACVTVIC